MDPATGQAERALVCCVSLGRGGRLERIGWLAGWLANVGSPQTRDCKRKEEGCALASQNLAILRPASRAKTKLPLLTREIHFASFHSQP